MKKCLGCENQIDAVDHYVCKDCYGKVKAVKNDFVSFSNFELKAEYERWKRNMLLARDSKYRNEYQIKVIAIAELLKEKYKDNKALIAVIDYSNNQKPKSVVVTKVNEKEMEDVFEDENKDEIVNLEKYETRYKCKDGHRVISKSERELDNWLTDHHIMHSYDCEIDDDTNFRYDFKLLDFENVFVEHWGYKTKKNYAERKSIKTKYYEDKKYTLINSDEDLIQDLNNFRKELLSKVPNALKSNK